MIPKIPQTEEPVLLCHFHTFQPSCILLFPQDIYANEHFPFHRHEFALANHDAENDPTQYDSKNMHHNI